VLVGILEPCEANFHGKSQELISFFFFPARPAADFEESAAANEAMQGGHRQKGEEARRRGLLLPLQLPLLSLGGDSTCATLPFSLSHFHFHFFFSDSGW
jgi:hypothetical protein